MRRNLAITGLVLVYLAAIVAANLIVTHFGPSAAIYDAFFLIALDLITRDRLADFWGTTRWAKMAALIATGAALSYLVNADAAKIALASCIAFASAELVEAGLYHLLRRRPWAERAPGAASVGAAIDSLVFPTLAFGSFMWTISFGQFVAKLAGAVIWTWVIARLLPPPSAAPARAS